MRSTRNPDGYLVCSKNEDHMEADEETPKIQMQNRNAAEAAEKAITKSLNKEKEKWTKVGDLVKKHKISHRFFLTVLKRLEADGIVELSSTTKKWRFRMTLEEKLKTDYNKSVEFYNTYKIEDYNVFRLMNPYEGKDKDFYNAVDGKTKSRIESMKIYSKLSELEAELYPKFVYLRGDQFASGARENKAGVILVMDKYIDYVNSSITSVYVGDGSGGNNYWLEPFNPPNNSFIKERIQKEVERKKNKIPLL